MTPIRTIIISHSFNQMVFAGNRFLAAVFAVQQGASPFIVGLLVALYSLAPTLFTVSVGKLIDRIGTQVPMHCCLVLMTASSLAPFLLLRMDVLYITAPLVGGAFFAIYLGINTLANHYSTPQDRAGNFSMLSVGISLAQGAAPLTAGICADYLGFAAAFAVITVCSLTGYLIFMLGDVKHVGPGSAASQKKAAKARTLDLLSNRDMRSVFVFSTLFILAWDIFIVMMPIYGTQLGLSASQMGMVMTAYGLASVAVRVAGHWLVRFYSPWQLMLMALALASVSTMAFGMITLMPLLVLCAFTMGLGQGLGAPMSNTALYEVAPKERVGEAMGLRMTLGMAAQTALPLAVGSVGAVLAAGPIFGLSGLVLFAGVVMERRHWRRRRQEALKQELSV